MKLISKIASLSVGLALAVGLGVAVGSKEARVAKADSVAEFTLSSALDVEVDGVTASFAKGSGSSAPAWYDNGLRLYVSNTITISSESTITGVTFNWEKQGSKAFNTVTANVGNYTHPSSAGVGTWSGEANEIVFTCGTTSKAQLQLNTFSVTYSGGSTDVLESITVTGSMSKTAYYVGESWSPAGLVATGHYQTAGDKDISDKVTWTYSPASPALNVTSVVATASIGEVSGSSSAQAVTVTKANPLKALYSKNNGDSITAVGYYVGFSAADGAYIMDGEYGFLLGDKNLDPSEWVEGETVLSGTGTLYKTSSNQYKFSYTGLTVSVVTDEAVIAEISEPVVYSSTGNETTPDYQNRITTVSGKVASVDQGSLTADPGTSDIKMTFTVGTNNVVVFYKKGVQDSTTMANLKAALDSNPKTEITVKGFTSWYNGFQVQMNGIVEEKEDYTAEDFAQDLINQTDAVCVNYVDGESSYSEFKAELTTIWNDLASNDKYPSLPGAQKTILAEAARDEEGTVVEQAMARYDFLTGKYDLTNFINGRIPIVPAGMMRYGELADTNNTMIIVVVIAAVSALAFTTLLVFKKKKQK